MLFFYRLSQKGIKMFKDAWTAASNKLSISLQKGVTMVEYTLIAALITVVAMLFIVSSGENVGTIFSTISSKLSTTAGES